MDNWSNLSKEERREYMMYQMSGSGSSSAFVPDDCYCCPICDTPSLSTGLCPICSSRFNCLIRKLKGEAQ